MRELDHGGEHALTCLLGNDATAAIELAAHRKSNENGQHDGHQRIEVADVMPRLEAKDRSPACGGEHHKQADDEGCYARPGEIALEAFERSLTPGQQWAQRRQQQQDQRDWNRDPVIERGSDGDLVALHESEIIGNQVPQRTAKQATARTEDC